MAVGAVLATQLNSHAAHPYGLFMNGLDVIGGVPTDSIVVVEAGSGGVSTLTFAIDDPGLLITVLGTEEVVLYDFTRDAPMFGGYVDTFTTTVDFGQQGRSYTVECSGYETLLDTIAVDKLTLDFTSFSNTWSETWMIQLLTGFTPLNNGSNGTETPTQTMPVQNRQSVNPVAVVQDFSGLSVRAGFAAFLAICVSGNPGGSFDGDAPAYRINDFWLTVDFYKGVRFAANAPADTGSPLSKWWTDYTTLTLTDTPTGTPAENLNYSEDHSPGAIVNGVYVVGGNVAGSGFVGSGQTPRREVSITDAVITTGAGKIGRGTQLISSKSAAAGRGSFEMTSYTPVPTIHPGSPLSITDARITFPSGNQLTHAMITEIRKTLNSGLTQNWTVTYQLWTDPRTGLALQGGTSSGQASAMATIKSS